MAVRARMRACLPLMLLPRTRAQVVRLEAPMLAMLTVPGEQYGCLYGLGTDQLVHKVRTCNPCNGPCSPAAHPPFKASPWHSACASRALQPPLHTPLPPPRVQVPLPTEAQAWAGLQARSLRSTARSCVHQCRQTAIAAPPSARLIATAAMDGTLVLHSPALVEMGGLDSNGQDPSALPSPPKSAATSARMATPPRTPGTPGTRGTRGDDEEGEEAEPERQLLSYKGGVALGLHDVLAQGVAALTFDTT